MSDLIPTDNRSLSDVTTGIASLVWWSFSGTKIAPSDLRDTVARAGMDPAAVPDIDPIAALKQAVREFGVREGRRKIREAIVVSSDPSKVAINILELVTDTDTKARKVPVDTLIWDRVTDSWLEPGASEDASNLRDRIHTRMNFMDGNAVRDYLIAPALSASQAFTLRRGVYVVPHLTSAALGKVQDAMAGKPDLESFQLSVAQVAGDSQSRATMAHMAGESVRDELAELQSQIDGWKDMANRVRSDTRERVLARFQELRQKAELYSEAMSVTLEDIQEEITEMEEIALDVIQVKDEESEARTPAPRKDASTARREAIRGMTRDQQEILWSVHCDGELPDEEEEIVEGIATALEAA